MSDATLEILRSTGLRVTQPRRAVLACVTSARRHLSAEEIHGAVSRALPGIALPTVYAVLGDLVRAGAVREVRTERGPAVFDPNPARHHHLVCRSCGNLVDVPCSEVDESQACLERPAAARGWKLEAADVTFRGLCRDCRAKGEPGNDSASGERGRRTR